MAGCPLWGSSAAPAVGGWLSLVGTALGAVACTVALASDASPLRAGGYALCLLAAALALSKAVIAGTMWPKIWLGLFALVAAAGFVLLTAAGVEATREGVPGRITRLTTMGLPAYTFICCGLALIGSGLWDARRQARDEALPDSTRRAEDA
jgi:hypothetical protein